MILRSRKLTKNSFCSQLWALRNNVFIDQVEHCFLAIEQTARPTVRMRYRTDLLGPLKVEFLKSRFAAEVSVTTTRHSSSCILILEIDFTSDFPMETLNFDDAKWSTFLSYYSIDNSIKATIIVYITGMEHVLDEISESFWPGKDQTMSQLNRLIWSFLRDFFELNEAVSISFLMLWDCPEMKLRIYEELQRGGTFIEWARTDVFT